MRRTPPPQKEQAEREPVSRFRQAIALVLAGGVAGSALTHWLSDSSSVPSKPPAAHVETVSAPESRADAAVRRAEEARRLFFLSGARQELSDEEITRRYLERERGRLAERAEKIADELGAKNPEDRAAIAKLVESGCTEIGFSNGVAVSLKKPQPPECDEPLELSEDTGQIWVDPEEYDALSEKEKAAIDLYRKNDSDGFLKQASFDDTRQHLRDFLSERSPGQETEARQLLEGMFTRAEQARDAYLAGDYARAKQLMQEINDFNPSDLSSEVQAVLDEMEEEGIPHFFVETFFETLEQRIGEKLDQ